jgi:hypothetical protein
VLAQLDDQGNEINHWRFPTDPRQLLKHLQAIRRARERTARTE